MGKKIVFALAILTVVFAVALSQMFLKTKSHREDRVKAANLIVYTHSSFMDAYGPGAELKLEFEKTCECTVEYIDAGGAASALERIRLDPKRRVDVIMGLDHLILARAAQSIRVQDIAAPSNTEWVESIKPFVYPRFVPYDWSPMGFVYRRGEVQPARSWPEAFAQLPKNSVSLPDPALSTPGLELLYWLFVSTPHFEDSLRRLKPIVHSYSPSWSASYGLFKKKQAKVTFSYLTSLVYHWQDEKDESYQFMVFQEGHPAQIEYAAVPDSCWNCNVAKNFVHFLISPFAQQKLAAKNYMLPVVNTISLGDAFLGLPNVKILGPEKLDEFVSRQNEWLELWRSSR